ncbi:hypothetical protein [Nonomuraea sp. bgisy101]|uniref:hypothetical protein n=1 Tax=Nonomuraea sp. bgisy101 TaxID=3413784 RepID=UPI003D72566B
MGRFLRAQADALPACDILETVTLNRQRPYILAVIEHTARRVRVLSPHQPTHDPAEVADLTAESSDGAPSAA